MSEMQKRVSIIIEAYSQKNYYGNDYISQDNIAKVKQELFDYIEKLLNEIVPKKSENLTGIMAHDNHIKNKAIDKINQNIADKFKEIE